jgi:hypothetical protein
MCLSAGLWPPRAQAAATQVDDWVHLWEVVSLVNSGPQPPPGPQIYYLGDASARESIVDDTDWTTQLAELGAPSGAQAHVLAGHDQTFGMDETVVGHLPSRAGRARRDLVVIGVGLTRFARPPKQLRPARLTRVPVSETDLSPWQRHRYDALPLLSAAQKLKVAAIWGPLWLARFERFRTANLDAIRRLIKACRARNLRPVLLDTPVNLAAAGTRLDRARSSYRAACKSLARKCGVTYLSFQRAIDLPSACFHDIHDLVHQGAVMWQLRLSRAIVPLIPRPAQP